MQISKKCIPLAVLLLCSTTLPAQENKNTMDSILLEPMGASADTLNSSDSSTFRILVGFTVNKDGRVSNITVIENGCRTCDENMKKKLNKEVTRIIGKYPIKPRRDSKGKPIPTRYLQPIIFKLEEEG